MGLINLIFRSRIKTHPCPCFERNSSTASPVPGQQIVVCHDSPKCDGSASRKSPSAGNKTDEDEVPQAPANNLLVLEQVNNSKYRAEGAASTVSSVKRRRTPEERALRMRNIVKTLNRRRVGICCEIERDWFLEGAHLEKHRHNLQVSHELTVRGLL